MYASMREGMSFMGVTVPVARAPVDYVRGRSAAARRRPVLGGLVERELIVEEVASRRSAWPGRDRRLGVRRLRRRLRRGRWHWSPRGGRRLLGGGFGHVGR